MFECGDSEIGRRFGELRREVLAECGANAALMARLREPLEDPAEPGVSAYAHMRGGLDDVERAARFLQLTSAGNGLDDPAAGRCGGVEWRWRRAAGSSCGLVAGSAGHHEPHR